MTDVNPSGSGGEAVIVRHILLAEPLAERFGQLFAGVDAVCSRKLAHAFRFDRAVERTGLTAVLRSHLAGQ